MYTEEKYHEQIRIEEGSCGHNYEEIFGRFLDASVTEVHVEDSYIRNIHQACITYHHSLKGSSDSTNGDLQFLWK